MRFTIRHLFFVITLFALFLAIDFPASQLRSDRIWQVDSIHRERGDAGEWHHAHPVTGGTTQAEFQDYIATLRIGEQTRTLNLGNTAIVDQHGLQLPEVGSYVAATNPSFASHGELPVQPVDVPLLAFPFVAPVLSLACAVGLVMGGVVSYCVLRRQLMLARERRMIDQAVRS